MSNKFLEFCMYIRNTPLVWEGITPTALLNKVKSNIILPSQHLSSTPLSLSRFFAVIILLSPTIVFMVTVLLNLVHVCLPSCILVVQNFLTNIFIMELLVMQGLVTISTTSALSVVNSEILYLFSCFSSNFQDVKSLKREASGHLDI